MSTTSTELDRARADLAGVEGDPASAAAADGLRAKIAGLEATLKAEADAAALAATSTGDVSAIDFVSMPKETMVAMMSNWGLKSVVAETPDPGMPEKKEVVEVMTYFFDQLKSHPAVVAGHLEAAVKKFQAHIWAQIMIHMSRINTVASAVYRDDVNFVLVQVDAANPDVNAYVKLTNNWLRSVLSQKMRRGHDNPLRVFCRSQEDLIIALGEKLEIDSAGSISHGMTKEYRHLGADFMRGKNMLEGQQCAALLGKRVAIAQKRGEGTASHSMYNVYQMAKRDDMFQ